MRKLKVAIAGIALLFCSLPLAAGDAPQWMHAAASRPVPAQDDRTDAVLLYAEENVNVISADKIKRTIRRVYKVLRPGGRDYGDVVISFNSNEKITSLRAWSIPAQGKDYEVKEKESAEVALPKVEGSELISDVRAKVLHIPAPDPGNVVGYEFEMEERPMLLQDIWTIQQRVPVLESRYSLQLPSGWEFKPVWLNTPEVKPSQSGSGWQWVVSDQKGIRAEEDMPPFQGVAGRMVVSFLAPAGGATNGVTSWQQMGVWYRNLTAGRMDGSPEIKQKVLELTAGAPTMLAKMKAVGQFAQRDIRYVAIELGIGGWQPHPAKDVFTNRYGDCKDKVTLAAAMLRELGVDSYYMVINSERGTVGPDMPAHSGFNHVILAIKLPPDVAADTSLVATIQHPKLGKLLFFDPTDPLTPFGQVGGYLQANYGLLVTPDGGELVAVPQQPASMNGITRTAKFSLDGAGKLTGEVEEMRRGDRAWMQRYAQRTVTTESARIKPIESLLANSLSNFYITKASLINLNLMDQPFGFHYSFEADRYAKNAGGLLLVRPRVFGSKASAILETDKPRQFAIEFSAPLKDEDRFEITLPPGYEVDELPPPVDADFGFARYHSRTEANGNTIVYTRTFEINELSVPASRSEELKKFYRIITGDERNTAVLKQK